MSLPFESEYNTEIVTKPMKYIPWNKGKTGVQDAWNKGKKTPESVKLKIGKANKGKPGTRNGTKQSEAAKQKIREANLGKKASEATRQKLRDAHANRRTA
jgi:hypothetical protein